MPSSSLEALAGVTNACQLFPTLLSGGQPGAAHLRSLKEAGVRVILDLRDPMEPRPFDEPAAAREVDLEYINIPVTSGALTDATLEQILSVLRAGDRTVFVHCASGNRVGGALIAYLMIDKGLSEEDATAQAMRAGLRSAEMLEWGLSYAKRNGGGAS